MLWSVPVEGHIIARAIDRHWYLGIAIAVLFSSCNIVRTSVFSELRTNMHIHILGICGTFMGGVAALARAAGFRVTGCDGNVYPPMSTQLRDLGVEIHEGFDAAQLDVSRTVLSSAMS